MKGRGDTKDWESTGGPGSDVEEVFLVVEDEDELERCPNFVVEVVWELTGIGGGGAGKELVDGRLRLVPAIWVVGPVGVGGFSDWRAREGTVSGCGGTGWERDQGLTLRRAAQLEEGAGVSPAIVPIALCPAWSSFLCLCSRPIAVHNV